MNSNLNGAVNSAPTSERALSTTTHNTVVDNNVKPEVNNRYKNVLFDRIPSVKIPQGIKGKFSDIYIKPAERYSPVTDEMKSLPKVDLEVFNVEYKPYRIGESMEISVPLKRNNPEFVDLIRSEFRDRIEKGLDYYSVFGTGTTQPKGLNSITNVNECKITKAGSTITLADLQKMVDSIPTHYRYLNGKDNLVWIVSDSNAQKVSQFITYNQVADRFEILGREVIQVQGDTGTKVIFLANINFALRKVVFQDYIQEDVSEDTTNRIKGTETLSEEKWIDVQLVDELAVRYLV